MGRDPGARPHDRGADMTRAEIFSRIDAERTRADEKHGSPCLPMYPPRMNVTAYAFMAESMKKYNDEMALTGDNNWHSLLQEEVLEAFAETEAGPRIEELIQVAAMAVKIIENIERGNIRQ
jgi:hypothetical protein